MKISQYFTLLGMTNSLSISSLSVDTRSMYYFPISTKGPLSYTDICTKFDITPKIFSRLGSIYSGLNSKGMYMYQTRLSNDDSSTNKIYEEDLAIMVEKSHFNDSKNVSSTTFDS